MTVHYEDQRVTLHHGDCLDVLRAMPDASVDAVVTDPPYGLGFMGKEWDSGKSFVERKPARRNDFDHVGGNHNPSNSADAARTRRVESRKFGEWCEQWAAECLRVLKPGGHILAFGGTRTWHRLACAVEDAGFEVRDSIAWLYGSGFPKSLDVSKAIDKAAGAEREVVGSERNYGRTRLVDGKTAFGDYAGKWDVTAPATDAAREWAGWGTALKPAFEPVVVARKPLAGTVAANVLEHGTGALNIDATRIEHASEADLATSLAKNPGRSDSVTSGVYGADRPQQRVNTAGRWPANVVLDDHQAEALDEQSGTQRDGIAVNRNRGDERPMEVAGTPRRVLPIDQGYGGEGGASRFFYVAKADANERPRVNGTAHPTVKPLALMRWLVRLVTPPGGTVLEPFAGSGTTVEACLLEGAHCIAIEKTPEYLPLVMARIHRQRNPVEAIKLAGDDLGLFELGEGTA